MFKYAALAVLVLAALCQSRPNKRNLQDDIDQWVSANPDKAHKLFKLVEDFSGMAMKEIATLVNDMDQNDMDKFVADMENLMEEFEEEGKKMQAEVEKILGFKIDDFDMEFLDLNEIQSIMKDLGAKKRSMDIDEQDVAVLEKMITKFTGMAMSEIADMIDDMDEHDMEKLMKDAEKFMKENEEEVKKLQAEIESDFGIDISDIDMSSMDLDDLKDLFERRDFDGVSGGQSNGAVSGGLSSGPFSGGLSSGAISGGLSSGALSGGLSSGAVSGGLSSGAVSGGLSVEICPPGEDCDAPSMDVDFDNFASKRQLRRNLKRALLKKSLKRMFRSLRK